MKTIEGFDYHVRAHADLVYLSTEAGDTTYAEMDKATNRLLHGFAELGLGRDDHVGVITRNRTEMVTLLMASMRGGPRCVPINNRLAPSEMIWIAEDAECAVLIAEQPFLDMIEGKVPDTIPLDRRFSLDGAIEGWHDFAEISAGQPDTDPGLTIDDDDVWLQIYTSGTTGLPKGVMLSEANSQWYVNSILRTSDLGVVPGDNMLLCLPLFHVGAILCILQLMNQGAAMTLRKDFNPVEAEELMATGAVNRAGMVPAMIQACLMVGGETKRDFSHVKSINYGASPIASDVLRKAYERYRCDFGQMYGMSETFAAGTYLNASDHRRALSNDKPELVASAGRPGAGATLTIRDADGNELPTGEVGEVCTRAGGLMKGYWKRPDATAEVIRDGEMRTGDAGRFDEEGYLYIVDRLKDIIVSGAENVSSIEVEEVLMRHPQIAEAAVIGVPHPKWGEAITAIVVAPDELTDEDVIAYCKEHLGGFKIPKQVVRMDALPRNGTGKVLKVKLREPYWEGVERRVS